MPLQQPGFDFTCLKQKNAEISYVDPVLQIMERDRVTLIQRLSDMRSRFLETLQSETERLSSELFSRHRNDDKTIRDLRIELAEADVKMQTEREKLEQTIQEEKRAAERQEALLLSDHAAGSRKLREEISKLRVNLQTVRDQLGDLQVKLRERDALMKIIQKERDCLELQLWEEIRKAVSSNNHPF